MQLTSSKEPALSLSKEPALSLSKEPALSLSKEPALSLSKGDFERVFRPRAAKVILSPSKADFCLCRKVRGYSKWQRFRPWR